MASLTETAKAVLEGKTLVEGIPTVGSTSGGVSNPNPVDPSTASTGNAKTLRPGSKSKDERHSQSAGSADVSSFSGVDDLDGATPTETPDENLGANAAKKVGKDTSRSSKSSVAADPTKKLNAMAEEMEDEGEVVEEGMTVAERLKALKEAKKEKAEKEEDHEEEDDKHEGKMEKCDEEVELSEELEDFIAEAIEAGLSEEEILAAIDENFEFISEEDESEISEALETYEVDMAEHVNALLEGENLSEEFHAKATTIFEAAVKAKLEEEVAASLRKKHNIKKLSYNQKEVSEQIAKIIIANETPENWTSKIEDYIKQPVDQNQEVVASVNSIACDHQVDSYLASILYHSKV
jgi:hypothetical protein